MLSYERRHGPFRTWHHKQPDGRGAQTAPPAMEFCLLLNTDTGAGTLTVQLNTDTGTNTHCVELNPSTAP